MNYSQSFQQFDPKYLPALEKKLGRELHRRQARRDLIAFTEWTFPKYLAGPSHRIIAEQLERVERGEIDRLMLLVPPRHGKSELASRRFPAYYLGRHPNRQFISASASAMLAEEFGRDVRNTIASEDYAQVFDTRLAEDSQAKGRWNTAQGGSYYAIGRDSQVMGKGAHVLLIDDPFAHMAEAQSELIRKSVWNWYTGTLYNRLEDHGAIILINHRMHDADLSGMLLQQQAAGGDKWEVVELKAIDDAGNALWPEKYPIEALERIKRNISVVSTRDWTALYQQNPVPDEGDYFKSEWIKPTDIMPAQNTLRVYGGSDYAVTSDGGDYTVHCVLGVDPDDRLYLLDLWRKQASSNEWIESWCDLVLKWKPMEWAEEQGQIRSGVGPFLERRAREKKAYCVRSQFPTRGDKAVRAQSIRGRMASSGLYVSSSVPWRADFESELLRFPAGVHDDQVDALGLVGQLLDHMQGKAKPQKPKPHITSGYKSMNRTASPSWRI
jgi:predicted phage terminase large subunit-like protein